MCKAKFTHSADVLAVASNPDNPDLILAAGSDLECRVHDVRTTKCAGVFVGAESDIEHVAFNPALSHFFVGASADGVCRIYDMRKNNSKPLVETPTQVSVLSFSSPPPSPSSLPSLPSLASLPLSPSRMIHSFPQCRSGASNPSSV